MPIISATITDLDEAVASLVAAFAHDHITTFLLEAGDNYAPRLTSLLLPSARAPDSPSPCPSSWRVTVSKSSAPRWGTHPAPRLACRHRRGLGSLRTLDPWPPRPHGCVRRHCREEQAEVAALLPRRDRDRPSLHGRGLGKRLLEDFCELSGNDSTSSGVYLETAKESNVGFYERAGFVETGRGTMGGTRLWCMYLQHEGR